MMITITFIVILLHAIMIMRLLSKNGSTPNRLYEPTKKQVIGFCLLILFVSCGSLLLFPAIAVGFLGDWMMRRNGEQMEKLH